MTSKQYTEAYVWIWLPEATEPVVAGKLEADGKELLFNYGKSYLARAEDSVPAIAIYDKELPLQAGSIPLLDGLDMPSCIRDAAPDAWGRRVIINRTLGLEGANADTAQLDELTYLLESGSDRIGALDFQVSPTQYVPRSPINPTLDELLESVERVQQGTPLTPELDQALFHGSSIGGARPKALIEQNNKKYVAKFSASSDLYSVVKAEFIAMRLAALAGLNVAPVKLVKALHKNVLLIERFDRVHTDSGWQRKSMLSALTLFGLDDMMARYASYETLAELIRHRFTTPKATLRELFSRLVFNILSGNTDDHARNHAAFWDGKQLALTPAYDICPQGRAGNTASQAMLIHGSNNLSQLQTCLDTAHNFHLSQSEAAEIIEHQKNVIETHWESACEEAELSEIDKKHVDVTLRVSGFFRDAFPNVMKLYDAAIQALANYDEAPEINSIHAHIEQQTETLIADGMSMEDANRQASYRVFGSKPGAYDAGLQGLINECCWATSNDSSSKPCAVFP